ncbi:peptidase S8 [Pseudarthrobacter sp. NIBRBAC000502772]|uniref:S8 family peptidase n=1 Tax=Pseudarthrobacter sp. NIBRBAC000502772 TaxID=2590775 RepID=UPI00113252BA|nr:S8 family serine peptidase [Pseudarthrobacter sp. NIBRBAC000502772]QDG67785.1 peptidase S8 [Pseudarthrobacter sp. NIBRBAC000502772]
MGRSSIKRHRILALSLAAAVGTLAFTGSPVFATPEDGDGTAAAPAAVQGTAVHDVAAGEAYTKFIVEFKETTANATPNGRANAWGKAAKSQGVKVHELRTLATGGTLIEADRALSGQAAEDFMAEIAASGSVDYVEPDARMTVALTPNDPRYGEQWDFTGTNGMRVPGAWDVATGTGVTVAVIDTGITAHPDLDANVLPGYDFVSDATAARDGNGRDANAQDQGDWYAAGECGQATAGNSSWHGTHVAGTVAAVTGNATGVAGVAPNAKVVPVRVLAKCGGSLSDIADAIIWSAGGTVPGIPANANPATVINMSLGGSGACGSTYQAAINSAVSRGATVVVAAGNSNQDASGFRPANCSSVVSVAASNPSGSLSYYSNYGSTVDLTAPGGDVRVAGGGILSTINTGTSTPGSAGYASYQGTSMAAPHVAGLAALMKSKSSTLTPAQVESTLKQGTRAMPGGCTTGCGTGLSDATKTMGLLGGATPPPSGNLLLNPGFESGAASWTSDHADTFETGTNARTGSGFAGLNGWGQATSYMLDQAFAVPSTVATASLSFYLKVQSDETTSSAAYDTLRVQAVSNGVTTTLATYSNLNESAGYLQKQLDLSAYKGKSVTLRFLGVEDSSLGTYFYLDDTAVTTS